MRWPPTTNRLDRRERMGSSSSAGRSRPLGGDYSHPGAYRPRLPRRGRCRCTPEGMPPQGQFAGWVRDDRTEGTSRCPSWSWPGGGGPPMPGPGSHSGSHSAFSNRVPFRRLPAAIDPPEIADDLVFDASPGVLRRPQGQPVLGGMACKGSGFKSPQLHPQTSWFQWVCFARGVNGTPIAECKLSAAVPPANTPAPGRRSRNRQRDRRPRQGPIRWARAARCHRRRRRPAGGHPG